MSSGRLRALHQLEGPQWGFRGLVNGAARAGKKAGVEACGGLSKLFGRVIQTTGGEVQTGGDFTRISVCGFRRGRQP